MKPTNTKIASFQQGGLLDNNDFYTNTSE